MCALFGVYGGERTNKQAKKAIRNDYFQGTSDSSAQTSEPHTITRARQYIRADFLF